MEHGSLDQSASTFSLADEDHTLANSLRFTLNQDPRVTDCGYSIPHPSEARVNIRVQTTDRYSNEDKELVDRDYKAFGAITMDLPNDVFHNFKDCKTAKELLDALELRFEGCAELVESRIDNWKRQFELFEYVTGETLNDQINRFTLLISNLKNAGVDFRNGDVCKKLLSSLPHKWSMQVMVIKRTNNLSSMTLEELIGLLQSYEVDMQSNSVKETKSVGFGHALLVNGSIGYSHAPLPPQTVSYIPSHQVSSQSYQAPTQTPQGSNLNVSPVLDEKNILYHAFVSSYEAYMAGSLASAEFEREDLEQISPDDLEEMDIQWQMAMLTIRAKRFFKRTGRNNFRNQDGGKVGFDKTKSQCYNCDEFGHFARECNAPKRPRQFNNRGGNSSGAATQVAVQPQLQITNGPTENQTAVDVTNTALITQEYDWSMDETLFANIALMVDVQDTTTSTTAQVIQQRKY